MRRLVLKSNLCFGDHCVMEMSLHSLHLQFPKEYITAVDIGQKDLFNNHPFISKSITGDVIEMHYNLVHKSNQIANSFADGYVNHLAEALDIPLKLQVNRPHLYLNETEKKKYKEFGKYWIIICGGKVDYTTKHLPQAHLQSVVDHYIGQLRFVQPVKREHLHNPLKNVRMVSNLNNRDMMSLVFNSSGIICPVTSWQHLAGAFEKPCVCIGGGREPISWVMQYPYQHYLHTMGSLKCSQKACWKSRVIKLNDNAKSDGSLCEQPVFYGEQWIPRCLSLIKPSTIIDTIDRISTSRE